MYCKLKIFWSIVDNLRQWSWSWRIKRSESRRTTRKRCTRITWNIYMYYLLYYDDYIIVFEKYIFTFYICTLCLLQMIKSNFSKFKFWGKLCSVELKELSFFLIFIILHALINASIWVDSENVWMEPPAFVKKEGTSYKDWAFCSKNRYLDMRFCDILQHLTAET